MMHIKHMPRLVAQYLASTVKHSIFSLCRSETLVCFRIKTTETKYSDTRSICCPTEYITPIFIWIKVKCGYCYHTIGIVWEVLW